ncbi:hypothetical protein FOA52_015035 [Chlamydomonas sp. UWO 241]|nr:hypothetical protein FOA52_015035 [Chlamydomonas sp. UWO 241]
MLHPGMPGSHVAAMHFGHALQAYAPLHMGLRTGLCGCLTTFASWMLQMVEMFVAGGRARWVDALWGIFINVAVSCFALVVGQHTSLLLHQWYNPWSAEVEDDAETEAAAGADASVRTGLLALSGNAPSSPPIRAASVEIDMTAADVGGAPGSVGGVDAPGSVGCVAPGSVAGTGAASIAGTVAPSVAGSERVSQSVGGRVAGTLPTALSLQDDKGSISTAIFSDAGTTNAGSVWAQAGSSMRHGGPSTAMPDDISSMHSHSVTWQNGTAHNVTAPGDLGNGAPRHSIGSIPIGGRAGSSTVGSARYAPAAAVAAGRDWTVWTADVCVVIMLATLSGVSIWRIAHDARYDPGSGTWFVWFSILFAPFGCIGRWQLGRLNGSAAWFPIGTFTANIAACVIDYALQAIRVTHDRSPLETAVLMGIMTGLNGSLSTVSTWVLELQLLSASASTGHRAYVYGWTSVISAVALGLLIYGVPVWTM